MVIVFMWTLIGRMHLRQKCQISLFLIFLTFKFCFCSIFDKGLHLPRPEVVPFRLTPNIIDAFGPTGADGAFAGGLAESMRTLRDNKDVLLSVLEPFLKDPVIDWKSHRSQQRQGSNDSPRKSSEAKRSMRVIEQRLKGMYNLRNPNARRIQRVDGHSIDEDDEVARLLSLSGKKIIFFIFPFGDVLINTFFIL